LPIEATILFPELDGTFPNHEADPIKVENLKWLSEEVVKQRADLGVAFDGDADRVVFVDDRGDPVRSDFMTAAFAEEFLSREPGASVVYDLRSSRATRDAIIAAGGRPVRERVGHSFIKATMRKEKSVMGGELSGHFYFKDNFVSDSGDIAMVTLLSILGKRGVGLRTLVAPFHKYHATGEINFRVADGEKLFSDLKKKYSDGAADELDGITVQYKDWWFNVRRSNTEPLVRLNLEANTEAMRDQKLTELRVLLGDPIQGGH
jgi:phosphomannomutase